MSNLIAKNNFITQTWNVLEDNLNPYYTDLSIGFTNNESVVIFVNLNFGFTLSSNDGILETQSYPPDGLTYIQTDQEYLVIHRINFQPEKNYSLFLWVENNGIRSEYTYNFVTPRPAQPYPSWIWNGTTWESPVNYPEDGKIYTWDEDTISWVEFNQ